MAPNDDQKPNATSPNDERGSVLDAGIVESRGMGTSSEVISDQIQEFLRGEGSLSPMAEVRGFFTVWVFVTRLPAPTWVDLHPGFLMRGMAYFPINGTLIGVLVSAFYDFVNVALDLPCAIASVVSQVASVWMTGCFHEDGLADSADGIGGGWTREQILRIMTDSRLGTYGCAVLLLYVVAKLEIITALGASVWIPGACGGAGPALIVVHTLSRLTAPMLIKTRDYVDEAATNPKSSFYSFFVEAKHLVTWHRVVFAMLSSFAIAALAYGTTTAMVLIAVVVVMSFFSGRYAQYLFEGVLGDYLGATICVTEIVLLIVLALLPRIESHVVFVHQLAALGSGLVDGRLTLQALVEDVWDDGRMMALLRFTAVWSFTNLWKSFVGPPPILSQQKSVATKEETNEAPTQQPRDGNKEPSPLELALSDSSQNNFTTRYDAARTYLDSLAKPVGSLGSLEDWAARLVALQCTPKPIVNNAACIIFAADHGVAKDAGDGGENCSAYPQAVTRKVLEGLEFGMAGASVLAKRNDVLLRVVDVGLAGDPALAALFSKVVVTSQHKIVGGTANFCTEPAMSEEEMEKCLLAGRQEVKECIEKHGTNVFVFGEVGIGNTTTSSALIAALSGEPLDTLCGSGAENADDDSAAAAAVTKKIAIIEKALCHHDTTTMRNDPSVALKNVGGAEIAAMVGAILEASERNVAVLVDGFIVTTAAMIACRMSPNATRVLLFTTQSTERGQAVAIDAIRSIARTQNIPAPSKPALDMNLRMGEGTGALMAVPVLRSAAAVFSDLATLVTVLSLEMKPTEG